MSRNAPCPCGSGRRDKECHGRLSTGAAAAGGNAVQAQRDSAGDRFVAPASHDAETLNLRGARLQAQRHYDEALACYDAALAVAPDHPGILGNRGNTLLDLRRHEEAAACFARL